MRGAYAWQQMQNPNLQACNNPLRLFISLLRPSLPALRVKATHHTLCAVKIQFCISLVRRTLLQKKNLAFDGYPQLTRGPIPGLLYSLYFRHEVPTGS